MALMLWLPFELLLLLLLVINATRKTANKKYVSSCHNDTRLHRAQVNVNRLSSPKSGYTKNAFFKH